MGSDPARTMGSDPARTIGSDPAHTMGSDPALQGSDPIVRSDRASADSVENGRSDVVAQRADAKHSAWCAEFSRLFAVRTRKAHCLLAFRVRVELAGDTNRTATVAAIERQDDGR